jgi:hypothetical protein
MVSWTGLASTAGLYWALGLGLLAFTVIFDLACLFLKRQGYICIQYFSYMS